MHPVYTINSQSVFLSVPHVIRAIGNLKEVQNLAAKKWLSVERRQQVPASVSQI